MWPAIVTMSIETWLLFCVTEAVLCLTPGPAVMLDHRPAGTPFRNGVIIQGAHPKGLIFFSTILLQFVNPAGAIGLQLLILGISVGTSRAAFSLGPQTGVQTSQELGP